MQKIKVTSGCAAFGFIFSFVFGLFSHSKFYIILLRALIFAVVFAAIGFLICFLFSKFLSDGESGEFENESNESGAEKGQRVNLVVEDQEFERGESENHFVVGNKHQMLHESDYADKESSKPVNSGYVPIRNVETVDNISEKESYSSSEIASATTTTANSNIMHNNESAINEGIDTLPDMDNFGFESTSGESGDDSDDSDAESYDTGSSFSSTLKSNSNSESEIQDAALMAKAISSVISGDDS